MYDSDNELGVHFENLSRFATGNNSFTRSPWTMSVGHGDSGALRQLMTSGRDTSLLLTASGITARDTNRMPWEPTDYMPGALAKALAHDEAGTPTIFIRSYPEGSVELPEPVVSYHLDRELYFILAGESPHWEFDPGELEVVAPSRGRLFRLREGYWLDRAPLSPHGGGTPRARVALLSLSFTVPDNDPFVGEFERSGLDVPAGLQRQRPTAAVVYSNSRVQVLSSRELVWEPHPARPESVLKVLSCRSDGDPTVTLRWVHGTEAALGSGPGPVSGQGFREFVYVIDGELKLDIADRPGVIVPTGGLIDAASHARWTASSDYPTGAGATVLHWRLRADVPLLTDSAKASRTRLLQRSSP